MHDKFPRFSDREILSRRPQRNQVHARRPYAMLVEPEQNAQGEVVDVATLFLVNRECPFRCLMCDLWKNTLEHPVAIGDIPEQIRWGLAQLPPAREIKLYNSGNFFDRRAIPPEDYHAIARLVRGFETVIVENHPRLCGESCLRFQELIAPARLEIALGLETCHPEILASLNKRMTLEDFENAAAFLISHGIRLRSFLLLKPPFLKEQAAIDWAIRSVDYAFDHGVDCCAVIPTRAGNGIMDDLLESGEFSHPQGASLEQVLERSLDRRRGRVFVDLWDAELFFPCQSCRQDRIGRLKEMNLTQRQLPPIPCSLCNS